MAKLIGKQPNQVPTNADLGGMAYQDPDRVKTSGGTYGVDDLRIGENNNYPLERPILDLDFVGRGTTDARMYHSRGSRALYQSGKAFAKAEENLVAWSYDIGKDPHVTFRGFSAEGQQLAPDGTYTAVKCTENSTNSNPGIVWLNDYSTGLEEITFSIWLRTEGVSGQHDVVLATNGSQSGATIYLTQEWKRYSVTQTIESGSGPHVGGFGSVTYGGGQVIYAWGPQIERRGHMTDFVPTRGQPISKYNPVMSWAEVNEPRIEHDPHTGETLGLLNEYSRTNIVGYSQHFAYNASHTYYGDSRIETDVALAPDGTFTADRLIFGSNSGSLTRNVAISAGNRYALSVYVKKPKNAGYKYFTLWADNGSGQGYHPQVDLDTGEIYNLYDSIGSVWSGGEAGVVDVGGGWYRVWVSIYSETAGTMNVRLNASDTGGSGDFGNGSRTADDFKGVYIWGLQLEQTNSSWKYPTSYIPTISGSVTRSADVSQVQASIFKKYNVNRGSFTIGCDYEELDYAKGSFTKPNGDIHGTFVTGFGISSGSYVALGYGGGGTGYMQPSHGQLEQAEFNIGSYVLQELMTVDGSDEGNIATYYTNGNAGTPDRPYTTARTPNTHMLTNPTLTLGYVSFDTANRKPAYIKRVYMYPRALTKEQAIKLTEL